MEKRFLRVFTGEIYLLIKLNFFGRLDVKTNFSLVNGCIKSNWEACKYNPLPFKINGSIPYSWSPKIGLPEI